MNSSKHAKNFLKRKLDWKSHLNKMLHIKIQESRTYKYMEEKPPKSFPFIQKSKWSHMVKKE